MIIKKELSFKKRLVLSPDRINELDSILKKYCDEIQYSATTDNATSLTFENREELLSYDNYMNGRIKSLNIACSSSDYSTSIDIIVAPRFTLKNETASCSYKFDNNDKERLFVDAWKTLMEKSAEYQASYMISKAFVFIFGLCLSLYLTIVLLNNAEWHSGAYLPLTAFIMNTFLKRLYQNSSLLNRVFPPAVFPWGEENKRHSKRIAWRSNLFWAAIVPTLISIALEVYSVIKIFGAKSP
ncbi:MAG: hypothetical protein IKI64_01865 [Clostridia bacterium]|nr:hypothetical protein [Clostridia bacterium]